MSNNGKLQVAIVGSGLAGLTAARILREWHDVTIYERSAKLSSREGQGLSTTPNAVRILDSIGFDRSRAGSVESHGYRTYDKAGKFLQEIDPKMKERFGVPSLTHLRVDVRNELIRLATAPSVELGIEGEPAKIVYNVSVKGLDAESGLVELADATKVEADLVVVADGIHSGLRGQILQSTDFKPKKSGLTCFRSSLSAERARAALGKLPDWWTEHYHMFSAGLDGTDRFILLYPTGGLASMNMSCIFRTREEKAETTESWNADGDMAEMLEIFHDFDENVTKLFWVVDEVKMWELQDMDPLPTWCRGRAILIGDAAHAMTPMQGQGANMAVEDGEAFRLFLQSWVNADQVPTILSKIDDIRRLRVAKVLKNTREASFGLKAEERFARMLENAHYEGIMALNMDTTS